MTKFEYTPPKNAIKSDEELLQDIRDVAQKLNTEKVSQPLYNKYGKYDYSSIGRRFGSWNNAILKAGLKISNISNYTDEELFRNILKIWEHKGTQPTRRDLNSQYSEISSSPYNRRFNSWTTAIKSFIDYANEQELPTVQDEAGLIITCSASSRDPSLRLRYKILKRDNFSCVNCGASPAKNPSVELHIDHIIPWSKGGLTEIGNLQTLCQKCNLGKSNLI